MAEYKDMGERTMKKNKIPKWWYAGFEKGFFYGCALFIKSWFWTYVNPLWTIRDKINHLRYKRRFKRWKN